jgi:aspartyl-tRNA synthetase
MSAAQPEPTTVAPTTPETAETKEKAPKVDKKAERAAARAAEEAARLKAKAEAAAAFGHIFGHAPLVQSTTAGTTKYIDIKNLSKADAGTTVTIRARVHTTRKQGNKMAFCVLRQTFESVQTLVLVANGLPQEMVAFTASIPSESIVDVKAKVIAVDTPITSTSKSDLELHVETLHVISESLPVLPFQFEDASRSADNNPNNLPTVNIDTRLGCRWMDMRTPAANAVFRLQSRIGQYFREFLLDGDFTEIHSPKMIGTASEGGANVFKLDYFGRPAYLAQSPQLYKQMALQGDLERVFEVAPVFRAENSFTHRHLTEFVGLDIEMRINEHYFEVLDVAEELFHFMFSKIAAKCQVELAAVCAQYPFEPLVWQVPEAKMAELGLGVIADKKETTDVYGGRVANSTSRMLRLPFAGAIDLLNTVLETKLEHTDDINTENEKILGKLVKARYGTDFYISDRFPLCLRPFYTMPAPDDVRFSNSYDMFLRGEEISSGAQRVHSAALLEKRATELGVVPHTIKDYIDSFRLGAWPHGGFGVGLERVAMLYLGLKNVRLASMFPRDPNRLAP